METPDIDELKRVYEIHQRHLEKARQRSKKPDRALYAREAARKHYERNKEAILIQRRLYRDAHREELNRRALERYYNKKDAATQQN